MDEITEPEPRFRPTPEIPAWRPPAPLTVVLTEPDAAELAGYLSRDTGWWYFQDRQSINGVRLDMKAEQAWEEDPNTGTVWVGLYLPGYYLACELDRKTAREVAAALTGESTVAVPMSFTCEPWDEDWLAEPVRVYIEAERNGDSRNPARLSFGRGGDG
ncbi:Uncharacterised protein [Mycolicibacterium vanbaalenii]|uniref:Uncharacterized protein n=1 Tax=Mycolicibacterium vanbaalenii TaxID=110539 RepID=A0A5S9R2K1_MYCVN|nr:hypothetical protein [Mycolicibacterium vanbaalenii]CAA0126467.1 Uncharacterised protein [Mycolicibacterium vanbaalenii]